MKKKNKKNWDVTSQINDNGSVKVYSMVNDGRDCWLMNRNYFFYTEEEARLTFIEDALNQGLALDTIK
jgi:hypothetical protein